MWAADITYLPMARGFLYLVAVMDWHSRYVLAWRLLGCSERVPRRRVCPVGNGVCVAFTVPARKRVKHVWTHWGAISGQLGPALAAQHRLGKRRRRPNPVQAVIAGFGSRGGLNRDQIGVPW